MVCLKARLLWGEADPHPRHDAQGKLGESSFPQGIYVNWGLVSQTAWTPTLVSSKVGQFLEGGSDCFERKKINFLSETAK